MINNLDNWPVRNVFALALALVTMLLPMGVMADVNISRDQTTGMSVNGYADHNGFPLDESWMGLWEDVPLDKDIHMMPMLEGAPDQVVLIDRVFYQDTLDAAALYLGQTLLDMAEGEWDYTPEQLLEQVYLQEVLDAENLTIQDVVVQALSVVGPEDPMRPVLELRISEEDPSYQRDQLRSSFAELVGTFTTLETHYLARATQVFLSFDGVVGAEANAVVGTFTQDDADDKLVVASVAQTEWEDGSSDTQFFPMRIFDLGEEYQASMYAQEWAEMEAGGGGGGRDADDCVAQAQARRNTARAEHDEKVAACSAGGIAAIGTCLAGCWSAAWWSGWGVVACTAACSAVAVALVLVCRHGAKNTLDAKLAEINADLAACLNDEDPDFVPWWYYYAV